jgi:glycosyl transferase family 1
LTYPGLPRTMAHMAENRWRKVLEPAALGNLAQEVGASLRSPGLPPVAADPQWTVDPASLDGLILRWPRVTRPAVVGRMLVPVRRAMGDHVRLELANIYQPVSSVVLTELVGGGRVYPVAIDLHDFPSFRDMELVKRCLVYFKMQHQSGGYGIHQVVPGGYLTDKGTIYWYLRYLRRLRDRRDFTSDVYGRFGLRFGAELRRRTVGILHDQQSLVFQGGLRTVPRASFLKEITRSRVCIDLPGQADAFCCRLISYMAVGACIVGPRPKNELNAPLIDRVHVAWTRDDLSDLVELCEYYVENEEARERMVSETRHFFDRYLHPESLAAYYLHVCAARLSEA